MADRIEKLDLQRVHYMPEELKPGILYYSEEFGSIIHLCACGCGKKTVTPIDQGWVLEITDEGPTIRPSIGNFQFPCHSHYLVVKGKIQWC